MASVLQTLANEAEAIFSKSRTDDSFSTGLSELLQSVNKIQASDLNIDLDTMFNDIAANNTAPVSSLTVFVNDNFSMDVFLLQDGARLPLHDHPSMHGIIKAIQGTLKITSYNPIIEAFDEPEVLPDDIVKQMEKMKLDEDYLIPVELHTSKDFTCKDDPSLLTPTVGNYHEICAVNGTAAMFDILAPPYACERQCNLYSLLETEGADSQRKMWLSEVIDLAHYWIDSIEYTGPKISI